MAYKCFFVGIVAIFYIAFCASYTSAQREQSVYILASKRDSVLRIDVNNYNRAETLQLPMTRDSVVVALEFDVRTNTIFWSDLHNNTISKMRLDGEETTAEHLVTSDDSLSAEGLAFDWLFNILYFTDGAKSTIESVSVDDSRIRRRLVTKPQVDNPRGIAVHPERGYIFWTDWSAHTPSIGRAHLDGSDVKILVRNPEFVQWPNGITIDYEHDRLFWVDAKLDKILSCDLSGGDLQVVLTGRRVGHAFAVGVYSGHVYWNDWITRGIYRAELKQRQANDFSASQNDIIVIKSDIPKLLGMKVYGRG